MCFVCSETPVAVLLLTLGLFHSQVDRFLHAMRLNDEQLKDIAARFGAQMKKGLSSDSNVAASVKMLPTHVQSTPDGTGDSLRSGVSFRKLRYWGSQFVSPQDKGNYFATSLVGPTDYETTNQPASFPTKGHAKPFCTSLRLFR